MGAFLAKLCIITLMDPLVAKAVADIAKKRRIGLGFIYLSGILLLISAAILYNMLLNGGSVPGVDSELLSLFKTILFAMVYVIPITLGVGISMVIETNRTTINTDSSQQKSHPIPLSSRIAVSVAAISTAAVMLIPTDDQLANQLKPITLVSSLLIIAFVVFVPHNRK